uniref:SWIM-type domain-containing protein n=1 Tax=Acrobeloides nanus TaxID=290746 RepID=A0A914C985_9BILA
MREAGVTNAENGLTSNSSESINAILHRVTLHKEHPADMFQRNPNEYIEPDYIVPTTIDFISFLLNDGRLKPDVRLSDLSLYYINAPDATSLNMIAYEILSERRIVKCNEFEYHVYETNGVGYLVRIIEEIKNDTKQTRAICSCRGTKNECVHIRAIRFIRSSRRGVTKSGRMAPRRADTQDNAWMMQLRQKKSQSQGVLIYSQNLNQDVVPSECEDSIVTGIHRVLHTLNI